MTLLSTCRAAEATSAWPRSSLEMVKMANRPNIKVMPVNSQMTFLQLPPITGMRRGEKVWVMKAPVEFATMLMPRILLKLVILSVLTMAEVDGMLSELPKAVKKRATKTGHGVWMRGKSTMGVQVRK